MKVELAKLQPSSLRDRIIDPIDEERANRLVKSIHESGFWGGVVLRKGKNGDLEIVAGNTRVYAALKADVTHADLHVGNYDDQAAIRIYATENATQRGESGLAMAGAVASAARYLIKAILKDDKDSISQIYDIEKNGKFDMEHLQGNIASVKGIGVPLILSFYKGVDGIKESVIQHHLANLKASGDYARIVKEVTEEIAKEHAEELAELGRKQKAAEEAQKAEEAVKLRIKETKAKAEHEKRKQAGRKATEAANKKKPTFDLSGVGRFFQNEFQLRTFREIAERNAEYLPLEQQAKLAEALTERAKTLKTELSAAFIKSHMDALIREASQEQAHREKESRRETERRDARINWDNRCKEFLSHLNAVSRLSQVLIELKNQYPDLPFTITTDLRNAVSYAKTVINELAAKLKT